MQQDVNISASLPRKQKQQKLVKPISAIYKRKIKFNKKSAYK